MNLAPLNIYQRAAQTQPEFFSYRRVHEGRFKKIAVAAAAFGHAFTKYVSAVHKYAGTVLKSKGESVSLFERAGIVFKRPSVNLFNEECYANALLDMMSTSGKATVASFKVSKASTLHLKISQSTQLLMERIPLGALHISRQISKEDVWQKKPIFTMQYQEDIELLQAYVSLERKFNQKWLVTFSEQVEKEMTLKELVAKTLKFPEIVDEGANLFDTVLIRASVQEGAISLAERMRAVEDPLISSMQSFFKESRENRGGLHLYPLNADIDLDRYNEFKQKTFVYEESPGIYVRKDFKTLVLDCYNGKIDPVRLKKNMQEFDPLVPIDEILDFIENKLHFCYGNFNLIEENFSLESPNEKVLEPLKNVFVKPYERMISSYQVFDVIDQILERLTRDSILTAIHTGEVQLLDLHQTNLGLRLKYPLEQIDSIDVENYENVLFTTKSRFGVQHSLTLDRLAIACMRNKVDLNSSISYFKKGVIVAGQLRDFPNLIKALNSPWEIVLFDTDLCLGESNLLQEIDSDDYGCALLNPLRSVFLETKWKDRPFKEGLLAELRESKERDSIVRDWSRRFDAPVYKRLAQSEKEKVFDWLKIFLRDPQFNFTNSRKIREFDLDDEGNKVIYSCLRERFVAFMLTDSEPVSKFWQLLDQIPAISRLKISGAKPDALALDLEVEKKRRLAWQLFPRLTFDQQNALFERLASRNKYLFNYQVLQQEIVDVNGYKLMQLFVMDETTPLISIDKENLLKRIRSILVFNRELMITNFAAFKDSSDGRRLASIRDDLLSICRPTFFNLMKAMYPLLADSFAFLSLTYRNPGEMIGDYRHDLLKEISDYENRMKHGLSLRTKAQSEADSLTIETLKRAIRKVKQSGKVALTALR